MDFGALLLNQSYETPLPRYEAWLLILSAFIGVHLRLKVDSQREALLIQGNSRFADHARPLRSFRLDERGVFLGCAADRFGAERGEAFD